jgi:hypothetical protein
MCLRCGDASPPVLEVTVLEAVLALLSACILIEKEMIVKRT